MSVRISESVYTTKGKMNESPQTALSLFPLKISESAYSTMEKKACESLQTSPPYSKLLHDVHIDDGRVIFSCLLRFCCFFN